MHLELVDGTITRYYGALKGTIVGGFAKDVFPYLTYANSRDIIKFLLHHAHQIQNLEGTWKMKFVI